MEHRTLLEKLAGEVGRYNDKAFLKAVMAVCALTAVSDNEVSLAEHYRIDAIIANEPALKHLDARKATDILYEYIHSARTYGDTARRVLYNKVRRMAGNHKKSRTLMRVAYLVITADHEIRDEEREEFRRLCGYLDLEPEQVWRELAS